MISTRKLLISAVAEVFILPSLLEQEKKATRGVQGLHFFKSWPKDLNQAEQLIWLLPKPKK